MVLAQLDRSSGWRRNCALAQLRSPLSTRSRDVLHARAGNGKVSSSRHCDSQLINTMQQGTSTQHTEKLQGLEVRCISQLSFPPKSWLPSEPPKACSLLPLIRRQIETPGKTNLRLGATSWTGFKG